MSDTDRETLSCLLREYGTLGVAQELAAICRTRAEDEPEPECRQLWLEEAQRYEAHA